MAKFLIKQEFNNNMEVCCRLGNEYQLKKNILYESDNFFIIPALGQIGIRGYVLLCSKEHHIGVCDVPKERIPELEEILDKARQVISEKYDSEILVFEHGPKLAFYSGGCCIDHAHLHIIPTSAAIMDFLSQKFKPKIAAGFDELKHIYEAQKSSYMFIEAQDRKRYVIKVDFPLPGQYLRQVLASKLGRSDWDWRANPDTETFEKTVEDLNGMF